MRRPLLNSPRKPKRRRALSRYGLLSLRRCFEFPWSTASAWLSLAKGYGGRKKTCEPYVPLQVAGDQRTCRKKTPAACARLDRAGTCRLAADTAEKAAEAAVPVIAVRAPRRGGSIR